jgi:hypothetical protein
MESSQMEVTDWLEEAVQQTKAKYQAQRALEDKLIQQQALKDRLAADYCEKFFEWLQTIDVKFNTRFGSQVLAVSPIGSNGDRGLQVLARPLRVQERIVVVNYQKSTNSICLNLDCSRTNLPQVVKLVLSADGIVAAEIDGEHYDPEQLGRKIVNDLLDIGFMGGVSRSPELPACNVSFSNIDMRDRSVIAGGSDGVCAAARA